MTVIDITEEQFQAEVLDRSSQRPVVVDFWAEWCGPCRALGPVLEREASLREGKIVLAKLDTDASPGISKAFQIQSIPAVKAFKDGKVVDEFVGALPAPKVAAFFDGLVPSEADELATSSDEASLRRALELQPGHPEAAVKLATMLYSGGDAAGAKQLLAGAGESFAADALLARIALDEAGAEGLADAFTALDAGEHARAADLLIDRIAASQDHKDELRRVVVGVLDGLGVDDPFAREARRRLATALY
jgi:putative thioredoxin